MTFSTEEARHALWFLGSLDGVEPGSFTKSLMQTFAHADVANRAKLATVFPGVANAMELARSTPLGLADLETIVSGGDHRQCQQGCDTPDNFCTDDAELGWRFCVKHNR